MHFIAHLSWIRIFCLSFLYYCHFTSDVFMEYFSACCNFFVVLCIVLYNFFENKNKIVCRADIFSFFVHIHGIFPCGETLMDFIDLFLQCNQQNNIFLVCVTILIFFLFILMKSCWLNFNFIYFYCSCGFK